MKISLVMLCYNNWSVTHHAVLSLMSSLTSQTRRHDIELLLVDNGSTDETAVLGPETVASVSRPPISGLYVRLPANMGIPIGMNIGIGRCQGDIIAFLNNDLVFPYGWLDALLEALVRDRSLGLAVPYLTYTSIPEQGPGPIYSDLAEMPQFARQFMEKTKGRTTIVPRVITSCVLFRRDLLDRIGGLDFWFGLGSLEDNDWSLRSQLAGYRNAVIGGSFVHHIGSVTYHQLREHEHIYGINGAKFLRKVGKMRPPYSRQWHYIPLTIEDFTPPAALEKAPEPSHNQTLLVADWTYKLSGWRETLADLMSRNIAHHVSLYIPSLYFDPDEVSRSVREIVRMYDTPASGIQLLTHDVRPTDFLRFVMSFATIATVPEDPVNRTIRFLKQSYLDAKGAH